MRKAPDFYEKSASFLTEKRLFSNRKAPHFFGPILGLWGRYSHFMLLSDIFAMQLAELVFDMIYLQKSAGPKIQRTTSKAIHKNKAITS